MEKNLQYNGYINTPNLWNNDTIGIKQFQLPKHLYNIHDESVFDEIRLGKRVEQFFDFQIKNTQYHNLLSSNIQIKNEKLTVGELDALVSCDDNIFHVEIVYKFYLYDPNINGNSLDRWIGPNRNDFLTYKLNKLKNKQLPLLFSDYTKPVLNSLNLNAKDISQTVCYKGQLYLPIDFNINVFPLNRDALFGYYFNVNKLKDFREFKFYIPNKLNWLTTPHQKVAWLSYQEAKAQILNLTNNNRSPMVWLKHNNGNLSKCFITFW